MYTIRELVILIAMHIAEGSNIMFYVKEVLLNETYRWNQKPRVYYRVCIH